MEDLHGKIREELHGMEEYMAYHGNISSLCHGHVLEELIGGELPRNRKYGSSPQFSLGAMLHCKWGSSLAKGS